MADEIECEDEAISNRRITRSAMKSKGISTADQQPKARSVKNGKGNHQSQYKTSNQKSSKQPKSSQKINRKILDDEEEDDDDLIDDNNNNRNGYQNNDQSDSNDDADANDDDEQDSAYNPYDGEEQEEHSDDDDDSSDDEKLITPLALANETRVRGQDVFGFQTPRGRGSLAQAASEAIHTKKIPASSNKFTKIMKKNGTSTRKRNNDKEIQEKEEKQGKLKKSRSVATCSRPVRSSSRRHQVASQSSCDSDEESAKGSSDDSEVSGFADEDGHTTGVTSGDVPAGSRKPKTFIADLPEDSRSMVEEYFAVHHDAKCFTSDRTLASLATPLMDHEQVAKHLQQVSATHPTESLQFYQEYRKYFAKWMFQIRHGFNLLLYGVGSKRVLIDQFRSSMLQGYTQMVVNGYFPSITIKNILNMITEDFLNYNGAFKSIIDQTTFIQDSFRKGKAPGELYLIIHNIDGTMLRSKKAQTVLSVLAEIPFMHVIASIDHINAPLVWDQCMCSRYQFLWYDVTTFEPYTDETSYENSLMVQQSGTLGLSSMKHVMRSLTLNGQNIFLLIVNHQLHEKDNSSYIGYNIYELYNKCREKFFVNSEQTLHAQLTEFRDHKLIRSKKGTDGVEHLLIPLDSSTLKQFLEEQQSNNQ